MEDYLQRIIPKFMNASDCEFYFFMYKSILQYNHTNKQRIGLVKQKQEEENPLSKMDVDEILGLQLHKSELMDYLTLLKEQEQIEEQNSKIMISVSTLFHAASTLLKAFSLYSYHHSIPCLLLLTLYQIPCRDSLVFCFHS